MPTRTHEPIDHGFLINQIDELISATDLVVREEAFGLSKDGQRMFGLLELESPDATHSTCIGVRNSNDKKFAAGMVVGDRTTVCDNLVFSGEHKLARKHTNRIMAELPPMIDRFVQAIPVLATDRSRELRQLKSRWITDGNAYKFILAMARMEVIARNKVVQVADEWDLPGSTCDKVEEFEEFARWGKSLYRLQQAFTTVMTSQREKANIFALPDKTIRLSRELAQLADTSRLSSSPLA